MTSYIVWRMVKKRETPKPTESELELLGILWERGPVTVRELFEAVNVGRPVVYTGVLKLLQIMAEKGLVERDERERAHVYRAAVSQADTERRFLRELSEKFFAGSAAQLALRALQIEKANDEELEAIRQLIGKKGAAR
jgi:BlaI family penicillinase repressor